ncbi:MAG: hypothetical protein Fur0041_11290 [Bacteroidia bacterium]
MGFVKSMHPESIPQLQLSISKTSGFLWLIGALLFIITVILTASGNQHWHLLLLVAAILSQVLIFLSWKEARAGTIINILLIIPVVVGFSDAAFSNMCSHELSELKKIRSVSNEIITKEQIQHLPEPVRKWLSNAHVIGHKKIHEVWLKQKGRMRTTPDGDWMDSDARQYFNVTAPGFIWITDVSSGPFIKMRGRDKFENGKGHMLIKVWSVIPVADAKGKEIDQGTMLRYLGEIVWFPSAALEPYLKWEAVDSSCAKVIMTLNGDSVNAMFRFNTIGDPVSFEAERYYTGKKQTTLEKWVVEIDPNSYRNFGLFRVPAKSAVVWKLKEGDFKWFELEITDIRYQ